MQGKGLLVMYDCKSRRTYIVNSVAGAVLAMLFLILGHITGANTLFVILSMVYPLYVAANNTWFLYKLSRTEVSEDSLVIICRCQRLSDAYLVDIIDDEGR